MLMVVPELRVYGPSRVHRRDMAAMGELPQGKDPIGELPRVTERGVAAAVFARQLPGSAEGQLVLGWLRRAAAGAGGARRGRPGTRLRAAGAASPGRPPAPLLGLGGERAPPRRGRRVRLGAAGGRETP